MLSSTRSGRPLWNPLLCTVRGMATVKQISQRLRGVRNMQKITASMKMVSASKFSRAEKELLLARPFGAGAQMFFERAEVTEPPPEEGIPKVLFAISSDKGLCGAVHTNIGKRIKIEVDKTDPEKNKVICVGDKSRANLQRLYSKYLVITSKEVGKASATFTDASKIAQKALSVGYNFGQGKIIYNRFVTAASYKTSTLPVISAQQVMAAPKLSLYDSIDGETIQMYMEYTLAALLFYSLKENACSEQSARMTAMDSSSKNAQAMVSKLELLYNRTRQALITTELSEIVSGAAAIDSGDK